MRISTILPYIQWSRGFVFAVSMVASSTVMAQEPDKSRYTLTNPTPHELMRELSTDRPDKTESAYTVDAGHFQFEMDFATFTTDRDEDTDLRTETLNLSPINLKVGLTNSTDLQIVIDSYIRRTVIDRVSGTRSTAEGFGDVTVRLKHNLWGNDGGRTALALMPFVKTPTNTNGLGNDAVEFGLIVPLAIAVSDRVGIGLMTEIDMLEDADGSGLSPSFVNLATVGFALTDRVAIYAEVFTERSSEGGATWVVTFDAGVTYALTDSIQLDAGVNLGVTDAADDIALFAGLSRRF
ncbi:transporter [Brevundimonas sp. DC300-4]|uniref:transporter n=1 Tax=Brevundimonas sp. DC300-4 TaxID=2804594 RepID=UPI003CED4767